METAGRALAMAAPTGGRRVALGLVTLGAALLCGAVAVALVLASDHYEQQAIWAAFLPLLGWSFIGTGLFAWLRRPESRVGLLMVLVGFAWFLKAFQAADSSLLYTLGFPLGSLYGAAFIHLLVSFPSGRLASRFQRVLVVSGYGFLALVTVPILLVAEERDPRLGCEHDCPRNLFRIEENATFADAYVAAAAVFGVALLLTVCAFTVVRWWRASRPGRRVLAPVLATGGLAAACFALAAASGSLLLNWLGWALLVALPFAFLAGLLRARLARAGVGDLVLDLRRASTPSEVRAALARALRDPSLVLAYWLPKEGRYVSAEGEPVELPERGGGRAVRIVKQDGARVAAIVYDGSLEEERELVESVAAVAAMALENAGLQAETRAHLAELRAAQARLIEAADTERQKLERDLHDGAQQRFVALSLALASVEDRMQSDPSAAGRLLADARRELLEGLDELRELARGMHPAALSQGGLKLAVETLAMRCPVPVTLSVRLEERLPERVETAAYFLISEALTNVAKYAHATAANVEVVRDADLVLIEVRDDGIGGADVDVGSGLRGLTDRVEALGGRLAIWSPSGRGTSIRAQLPCAS